MIKIIEVHLFFIPFSDIIKLYYKEFIFSVLYTIGKANLYLVGQVMNVLE